MRGVQDHSRARQAVRLAWGLFGLTLVFVAAFGALSYAARGAGTQDLTGGLTFIGQAVVTALLGALVLARYPRNPIGWIFLVAGGVLNVLNFDAQLYSLLALRITHHGLPGGVIAAWLGSWIFIPGVDLPLTFAILLFPDGRLPSPRWRAFAWGLGILVATALVAGAIGAWPTRPDFRIDGGGSIVDSDRLGLEFLQLPVLASSLVCLWAAVQRFRRARGDEREQMKWFTSAIAILIAGLAAATIPAYVLRTSPPPWSVQVYGISSLAVPVAMGVAILKYRLYDIDIVISRALVYGALAAFITAVYVAIVVGVGTLVGAGGKPNLVLSIIATAIVAVAFQPVRERLQRFANRLVYGKRATPYEVLSEFSGRVAETYSADDVLPRMARVLAEGTGAEAASVWLRAGDQLRPAATHPEGGDGFARQRVSGQLLPELPGADHAVPVRHQGELLGALAVRKRQGETLTPIEEKLLDDLAKQAGLVLKNVGLTADLTARLEDLRESRLRLVAAQDQERRRLERNLHDGAQQHLVALKVKLGLAEMLTVKDPERAKATIAELKGDADEALETLRDLARGIYPPLLADKGLPAALEAQARKATVPVSVEAEDIGRYPQEVEAAVYFCVLEALQNVQKYAGASRATVRLVVLKGELDFEVEDDGSGFDAARVKKGSGLTNMADRLDAIGGDLEIDSEPGRGTRLRGRSPVPAGFV